MATASYAFVSGRSDTAYIQCLGDAPRYILPKVCVCLLVQCCSDNSVARNVQAASYFSGRQARPVILPVTVLPPTTTTTTVIVRAPQMCARQHPVQRVPDGSWLPSRTE